MFRGWKSVSFGVVCAAGVSQFSAVFAECPCNRPHVRSISQSSPLPPIPMPNGVPDAGVPQFQNGLPPAPPPGLPAPMNMTPTPRQSVPPQPTPVVDGDAAPLPLGQTLTPTPVVGDYAPVPVNAGNQDRSVTNRFGVTPPPGTLGRTYQQRSRIFDDEKHPRMAAVDVYLPEDVDLSARGMKSVWTGKLWRLEAKDPLLPGVPHIYAIKAEKKSKTGEVLSTDVRWIRLIPGRVVDLHF